MSERPGPDTCNAGPKSGDIYMVRKNPPGSWDGPWGPVHNLGCAATGEGPNFDTGEFSPYLLDTNDGTYLYFSSFGPFVDEDGDGKTDGDMDIYVSELLPSGRFSMPEPVEELNTEHDDRMPNLRRDGLEIVFSSNRPGGFGSQDVYSSTREDTD